MFAVFLSVTYHLISGMACGTGDLHGRSWRRCESVSSYPSISNVARGVALAHSKLSPFEDTCGAFRVPSLLAWCKWYFMLESWESKNTKTRHIGRSFCCSHIDLQTFTLNPIPNFYGTTFSSYQRQVQTSKFEIGLVLLHRNIDHLLIHRGVRNFGLRSHLLHKLFLLFEHELGM